MKILSNNSANVAKHVVCLTVETELEGNMISGPVMEYRDSIKQLTSSLKNNA